MDWSKQKFAIIDIETTGGNAVTGKMTEIAVYVLQDGKVINELVSLVNPEQAIPFFISNLTGINDSMVADAPKFFEIAKSIIEITENAVFVAHNSSFDYGFVKEEFRQLGFSYDRKTLCTVQLSRKIIPGHASYSLGKLTEELGIQLNNRHRASGDALATVELFKLLQKTNSQLIEDALTEKKYRFKHQFLKTNQIIALPETSGLFCFKNDKDEILFIEKCIDIRTKVLSHLNKSNARSTKMLNSVKSISYRETGSELISLLEETIAIKKHKPLFNKSIKRNRHSHGIYSYKDDAGYINFEVKSLKETSNTPFVTYNSVKQCNSVLSDLVLKNNLCQKLSGLTDSAGACFYQALGECKGACVGEESVENYNNRAQQLIARYSYASDNFMVIDRGRKLTEKSVVLVEASEYRAHGFVSANDIADIELIKASLQKEENSRDIQKIINSYIKKHPDLNIVQF